MRIADAVSHILHGSAIVGFSSLELWLACTTDYVFIIIESALIIPNAFFCIG